MATATPVQYKCKNEIRDLQQLTPPDSDSDKEKDDKPFRCGYPKCNYETNRRNNLKRHMMTMHERLSSPHYCCGVTFFRKADMRAHTKEVHSEGYPCTWPGCGKGFVRKALLDRHLKIHTGEKPYVCPVCQYGTSHKSNLDRHVRIHFKGPHSPAKLVYSSSLYDPSQLQNPSVMLPHPPTSHNPFLGSPWTKTDIQESCTREPTVSTLPDSTTDHVVHMPRLPASPTRRQSFLFSPDKFSVPFSPCNLDSITPLKLSPVKNLTSSTNKLHSEIDSWWSPSSFTPIKLSGTLGLTPNTSTETDGSASELKGATFLSTPATPPTPGKRSASQAFSHGIRSILGDITPQEEEEDIDVDGDSSDDNEDYEKGDEDDYVPKKLRLAKNI